MKVKVPVQKKNLIIQVTIVFVIMMIIIYLYLQYGSVNLPNTNVSLENTTILNSS